MTDKFKVQILLVKKEFLLTDLAITGSTQGSQRKSDTKRTSVRCFIGPYTIWLIDDINFRE